MKNQYKFNYANLIDDTERSLYGISDALVENCRFQGEADGESCLKETKNLYIKNCFFGLRYPLWHNDNSIIDNCVMPETCRAAMWYDNDITIKNLKCDGIKAIRECNGVRVFDCCFNSPEFCWLSNDLTFERVKVVSEYPFFTIKNATFKNLEMKGKYSFQYAENVTIEDSVLDTKDAFWHTKNVTVKNSIVKGEYLAWYSDGLTLINCKIIGTQPLCYAKNLKLIDCETEGCDLSFENSVVDATIKGYIESVKNPIGKIVADKIGEIIIDEYVRGTCKICDLSKINE